MAIIQDNDGYTNVREHPGNDSEIIFQVNDNEVFFYSEEDYVQKKNWIEVFIPKNMFSIGCTGDRYINGFMHISRVLPLKELKELHDSNIVFKYINMPFGGPYRQIEKQDNKWVIGIDGRRPYGIDGNMPDTEVERIEAIINGFPIKINKVFYSDIFNCSTYFRKYENGDTYFMFQQNGDGAVYYEIVYVISQNELKQRLIGSIL